MSCIITLDIIGKLPVYAHPYLEFITFNSAIQTVNQQHPIYKQLIDYKNRYLYSIQQECTDYIELYSYKLVKFEKNKAYLEHELEKISLFNQKTPDKIQQYSDKFIVRQQKFQLQRDLFLHALDHELLYNLYQTIPCVDNQKSKLSLINLYNVLLVKYQLSNLLLTMQCQSNDQQFIKVYKQIHCMMMTEHPAIIHTPNSILGIDRIPETGHRLTPFLEQQGMEIRGQALKKTRKVTKNYLKEMKQHQKGPVNKTLIFFHMKKPYPEYKGEEHPAVDGIIMGTHYNINAADIYGKIIQSQDPRQIYALRPNDCVLPEYPVNVTPELSKELSDYTISPVAEFNLGDVMQPLEDKNSPYPLDLYKGPSVMDYYTTMPLSRP